MLPSFVTTLEQIFVLAAQEICAWRDVACAFVGKGEGFDTGQRIEPLPLEHNLAVKDRMGRLVISCNYD